jgi:hypothetical protein
MLNEIHFLLSIGEYFRKKFPQILAGLQLVAYIANPDNLEMTFGTFWVLNDGVNYKVFDKNCQGIKDYALLIRAHRIRKG